MMCGRYALAMDDQTLLEIVEEANRRPLGERAPFTARGEIFPSDAAPVLANNRRMEPCAYLMRWGYALPSGKLVINARSETAKERPLFQESLLARRCLIPASHYFEWARQAGGKVKYALRPAEPGAVFMAGLYRHEPGNPAPSFVILTREAAPGIAFLHDRMPVILPRSLARPWLSPQTNPARLIACALDEMRYQIA